MASLVGQRLGKYQIREEIGRGGMGTVYKGYDTILKREVAIKVLSPHLSVDPECVERFLREAETAAKLQHPNIVPIFDVGQQKGVYYLVMQYLAGSPLSDIIDRQRVLSPERAARIVRQVASALDYAHSQGLVHRDIKPANIIVGPDDHVTLTDFSIVRALATTRLTRTGMLMGTPAYMAPEQGLGREVGPAADIYALGIVCYEMLTGITPFRGETPVVLHAHVYETPPPIHQVRPQLSPAVGVAVSRALAKDPRQRWGSAGAFAQSLSQAVGEGLLAAASAARTAPQGRSKAAWWAVGSSAAATIMALVLLLVLGRNCGPVVPVTTSPAAVVTESGTLAPEAVSGVSSATLTPVPTALSPQAAVPSDTASPGATTSPSPSPTPSFTPTSLLTLTHTPVPPTDTPTQEATPALPTDTPTMAATPVEAASPIPPASKTPKPKATPRTGKILLTSNRVSWDDIFVMNDDGADIKRLTTMGKCYDATFTPDGTAIVFEHDDDIWKMSADGSGQANLTNTPDKIEAYPVIAPDGKRIAFLFGWPGGFEIYTMKLDGTDQKPITSQEFDWMPTWSPDGQRIAFSSLRGGSFNIWVVNRDGSDLKQVTRFGPERVAISPVFAPEGNRIAFSTISEGTAWEIWVVNLDGSNAHKVVGTVGASRDNSTGIVAWRQGKFLIAGWQGNWDPYFVSEGGGEPVRVIAGEKDDKPSDWWVP